MDILVYPVIALLFVAIFTREVIAPASKNPRDRCWLIMVTLIGVRQRKFGLEQIAPIDDVLKQVKKG